MLLTLPAIRPHFQVASPCEDVTVVISEHSEHLLHGEIWGKLLSLLDGRRTTDEVVDAMADIEPPEKVYYRLLKLETLGFLENGGQDNSPERIFSEAMGDNRLSISPDPFPATVRAPVFTGQAPGTEMLKALENAGFEILGSGPQPESDPAETRPPRLVVAGDLLDPELKDLNNRFLESREPWVLFRPAGTVVLAGPMFVPGKTACWNCLAEVLKGHRYVEAMVNRGRESYQPLNPARGWTVQSLILAAALLSRLLDDAVYREDEGVSRIASLDLLTGSAENHILRPMEDCPYCGHAGGKPLVPPPGLVSRPLFPGSVNGGRIRPAGETLLHLNSYISRISGVVGTLREFHPEAPSFGFHYQATYPARRTPDCLRKTRADRFGVSNGKGPVRDQAKVSAIAEAVERYSSRFRRSSSVFRASLEQAGPKAVPMESIALLSHGQRCLFSKRCGEAGLADPFLPDTDIDWAPAGTVTGGERLVPSCLVHYPLPSNRDYLVPDWTTNGLSAGSCLEEALLQGLLEVVERDAIAIWWYNRLTLPGLDPASFGLPEAEKFLNILNDEGWNIHLLNLTTDLNVPVIASVGLHRSKRERDPIVGFGADFRPDVALSRALGEMAAERKSEPNIFKMNMNALECLGHDFHEMEMMRPLSGVPLLSASSLGIEVGEDLLENINTLAKILKKRGMEVLYADLSRTEAPLSVVRVLVPGMRQVLPQLGRGRLYEAPVLKGAMQEPKKESELNPMPFWQLFNRVAPGTGRL